MKIKFLNLKHDYREIEEIWNGLLDQCEHSYFLSWGWTENWIACMPPGSDVRLAVISNRDKPILAFFIGKIRYWRHGFIRSDSYLLNETGNEEYDKTHIEYNAILSSSETRNSLLDVMKLLPKDWDEIYFPGLDCNAFPGNQLQEFVGPYLVVVEKKVPSPYVDLEIARKLDGSYLPASSNSRYQVRRSYRLYKERGPVVLELAQDLTTALKFYDEMVALHQKSWNARHKVGVFESQAFYQFHRRLVEMRASHGEIQLLRVLVGESTLGCLYNFVYRGKVYSYQSGLTYEGDNRLKPGLICHLEAVNFNSRLGYSSYDFLGGAERYKISLATHQRELAWVRVQKPKPEFWVESNLRKLRDRILTWTLG
ncbi:MAG: GNAT family N-acetyltransferase [Terriglobia bacterium]